MSKRFARVGDFLPAVLKSFGLEQKFRDQKVLALWPEVVGEQIAARTRAVRIEKGVLFVHVDHGAWMQELHFKEKELVKKLREKAPQSGVRRIRFGTSRDSGPLPEERSE
jgi:predicted nucleic acid-binding Zn ribbon protein